MTTNTDSSPGSTIGSGCTARGRTTSGTSTSRSPSASLTVFTGVSGSGKSSLVFDTIAAESQRLINETYSAFVQGFMPTLARPEGPGAGHDGGQLVFQGTPASSPPRAPR